MLDLIGSYSPNDQRWRRGWKQNAVSVLTDILWGGGITTDNNHGPSGHFWESGIIGCSQTSLLIKKSWNSSNVENS